MQDNVTSAEQQIQGFVSINLPCRYSFLRVIRQTVSDLCARAGMSEMKAATLEMAVDEACSNVMEHSYGGEHDTGGTTHHPGLRINLIQEPGLVMVEIFDHGDGFEFDRQGTVEPETYLENGHERGLGMYIIRKFVDDIAYARSTPQGHCLRMIKRL